MNQKARMTDVQQFMQELDGGVFEEKLASVLSGVAAAVVDFRSKGKVVIELDFSHIGNGARVNINHKLKWVEPTRNGEITEVNKTETPFYVGVGGALSVMPQGVSLRGQTDLLNETNEEGAKA